MIARSFSRLVDAVEADARWLLALWVVAAVALTLAAPSLNDVGSTDTADFLPAEAPSQQADRVLARLFLDDPTRESSIVVFARDGGLTEADHAYVGKLTSTLTTGGLANDITGVQSTATSPELAAFLRAPDGEAELLIASMADAPFSTSGTSAVERLRDHLEATAPDAPTTSPTSAVSPPTRPTASSDPSTAGNRARAFPCRDWADRNPMATKPVPYGRLRASDLCSDLDTARSSTLYGTNSRVSVST